MIEESNLEFRKIKSLNFLYEISEDGRIVRNVKSKKRTVIKFDKDGYAECWFCIGGRKGKVFHKKVHHLVAECWLGEKPQGLQVDHIDRNKLNNHYTNLRYATHSEQMKNRVLSDRIIKQATANCYKWSMENIAKPCSATNGEITISCASMSKCADVLGKYLGEDAEHIRAKMKKRRSHIYGFDITYEMQRLDTAT